MDQIAVPLECVRAHTHKHTNRKTETQRCRLNETHRHTNAYTQTNPGLKL